jgi:hypothetical protein
VANPGVEVGSCKNTVLLNPPQNRTTVIRYYCYATVVLYSKIFLSYSSSFSGLAAHN